MQKEKPGSGKNWFLAELPQALIWDLKTRVEKLFEEQQFDWLLLKL